MTPPYDDRVIVAAHDPFRSGPDPAGLVDPVRLTGWLSTLDPPVPRSVRVTYLAAGHSNLTYLLEVDPPVGSPEEHADSEGPPGLVLRRPPAGPLLPTAHDVLREHRVLAALSPAVVDRAVRVPRVVAACADPGVIGAPFYLAERVAGDVVRGELPGWLRGDPVAGRALSLDLVEALAEIHRVPVDPLVDAGIGRPTGYLARQLRRWTGQREGIRTTVAAAGGRARELADYEVVRDWLIAHVPAEVAATLVHGDYKLDNVVVGPPGRVRAVLDWEMATVGDPRADLGYLLSFWVPGGSEQPEQPDQAEAPGPLGLVTLPAGAPPPGELVDRWQAATGRDPGPVPWFVVLARWKLAILLEASYYRWSLGQSTDPFFATLDTGVPALLASAREVAGV